MAARRFPLVGKGLALAGVLIALGVALQTVGGIVAEREGRLREAERGVAASLAGAQTLVGPLLVRDCTEAWDTARGEGKDRRMVTERHRHRLSATPKTLEMKANARLEPRYRGIFKVNGYVLKASLSAAWSDGLALQPRTLHAGSRLQCDAPVLFVSLGDSRGIRAAAVQIDGVAVPALPGTRQAAHPRGFHAEVAESFAGAKHPLRAEIALELVGTGELAVAPVGDSTRVELASDWPHPSFSGRFLPVDREVGDRGFTARWQLNALATTAPQAAREGSRACRTDGAPAEPASAEDARGSRCIETFGVAFIDPVGPYVLADRATKYGLLFILLTFAGVGAVEVMRQLRVHPVQYLLVGAALATFFLLLVSLSEHVAFAAAYLVAGAACTLLLAFYGAFVLRGARAGAAFGAGVAALYAALYALLQLEQSALLLGSTLLFIVLAVLMSVTRRIDWYALLARLRAGDGEPAQTAASS